MPNLRDARAAVDDACTGHRTSVPARAAEGKLPRRNRVVLAQKATSPGERRDTEFVNRQWMHAGRLWTNGDPFLAVDATLRDAWQGFSNDQFSQVAELGPQDTRITAGTGRAAVAGAGGVVRDDSWMEVFEAASGRVAIVQASGPDYPDALARALEYPDADDEDGGTLNVSSGELAIVSAAADGAGPYSMPLLTARPGIVPPVHGPPPSREADPGLLFPSARTAYRLKVRWYTELDEDNCFARWPLIPVRPDDRTAIRAALHAISGRCGRLHPKRRCINIRSAVGALHHNRGGQAINHAKPAD